MIQVEKEEIDEQEGARSRSLSLLSNDAPNKLSPVRYSNIRTSLDQLYQSLSTIQLLKEQLEHDTKTRIEQLNLASIHIACNFRSSSIGRYLTALDYRPVTRDKNNNCPVNDDEVSLKPVASPVQNFPLRTSSAPLLEREKHAKTLKCRLPKKKKGGGKKVQTKKTEYMLVPLSPGLFGDVMQKKPNGKPKYTDVMNVIYQGTSEHKNVNTTSANKYESLTTLEDSHNKRLYYVKPLPEEAVTLQDLINPRKGRLLFTEFQAKFLCASLMLADKFLNDNEIVHGSLMPKKIVFNEKFYPQIAYLNHAEILSERLSRFRSRMPLQYTAPELCYEDIYDNTDVFTIAVMVYEALFGRAPHLGENDYETRRNVCNRQFDPEFNDAKLSKQGQKFLKQCLRKSESKRFNLADLKRGLFKHVSWFDDLDEDKMFEQAFPSPLKAKIQAFRKEQKMGSYCGNIEKTSDTVSEDENQKQNI